MEGKVFIYGLYTDGEDIRYVGKTNKQDIKKRLKQHILKSKELKTHRDRWIQNRINEGKEIKIKEIEVANEKNWQDREKYWIKYYRENGDLTNHCDGGEGGACIIYTKSYEEIKNWVQNNLNIKSKNDWYKTISINKSPDYIPLNPRQSYLKRGWISWGDFLGTGNKYDNDVSYLSYDEAKEYIKKNLSHLDRTEKWKIAAKNSEIPEFIPNRPERYYSFKNRGWISYGDFLGTGRIANQNKTFISYEEAKKHISKLNIKSETEWRDYIKTNKNINNIPSSPENTYKNKGWIGWGDFLNTGKISDNEKHKNYLNYEDAKKYLRENFEFLKSSVEWNKYFKQDVNPIPYFIPLNPSMSYKKKGWSGWADFLNKNKGE